MNPGLPPSNSAALTITQPLPPTITGLSRTNVQVGTSPFTLKVFGRNFYSTSTVGISCSGVTTGNSAFVNSGEIDLTVSIPGTLPGGTQSEACTVIVNTPGAGSSNTQQFTIVTVPVYQVNININPSGAGTVNGTGLLCGLGNACSGSYPANTVLTLFASSNANFDFTNWTGNCSGTSPIYALTVSAASNCQANFSPQPGTITVNVNSDLSGEGFGDVQSNIPSIGGTNLDCSNLQSGSNSCIVSLRLEIRSH